MLMDNKNEALTKEMILAAGLPIRGSYRPGEVCAILGISKRSLWRMVTQYEPDQETGKPKNPATLDSYKTLGQRRVRFNELVNYVARNNTYERLNGISETMFKA